MEHTLAVEAVGIGKRYGSQVVLRGVDLSVPAGSVFALLGPNGAGKTTMVKVLATLIDADEGSALVAGVDVRTRRRAVRERIALTGQYAALDELQTGAENLRMMGRLAGLGRGAARRRSDELVDAFDLRGAARRPVKTYSGGMRRRLDIAASLVVPPQVLFLDEPTTGLDPRSRQAMWEMVRELVDGGVSIFLTTQYLEEADQLADRIAVLDGGRVVAEGTADELKRRIGGGRLDVTFVDGSAFAAAVERFGARTTYRDDDALALGFPVDDDAAMVRSLLDELDPRRSELARFDVRSVTLDDAFLALTARTPTTTEQGTMPDA